VERAAAKFCGKITSHRTARNQHMDQMIRRRRKAEREDSERRKLVQCGLNEACFVKGGVAGRELQQAMPFYATKR
jgi:hypothetical protein